MYRMIMRKFCFSGVAAHQSRSLYMDFDDEFDDVDPPLGQCTVLYNFEGTFGGDSCSTPAPLLLELVCLCSCGWRFHFLQATARAPYPSQRESCWASWRRTKATDGWGSWEATAKRALYLHPMSAVIVKTVWRDQSNQPPCSLRQERLPQTISAAWSHKAPYECAQHMFSTIVARRYIFYVHISTHLTFPLPLVFARWSSSFLLCDFYFYMFLSQWCYDRKPLLYRECATYKVSECHFRRRVYNSMPPARMLTYSSVFKFWFWICHLDFAAGLHVLRRGCHTSPWPLLPKKN